MLCCYLVWYFLGYNTGPLKFRACRSSRSLWFFVPLPLCACYWPVLLVGCHGRVILLLFQRGSLRVCETFVHSSPVSSQWCWRAGSEWGCCVVQEALAVTGQITMHWVWKIKTVLILQWRC